MPIECEHWTDCGVNSGGCCKISKFGDRPSHGVCLSICKLNIPDDERFKHTKKSRGLGDTVKKIIDTVTFRKVKPCGGCKKRREALNKLIPYGDKDNGR